MKALFHPSDSRGLTDLGWLKSRHSFSFGDYHDAKRVGFGALRVLNDDWVAGGQGFGSHPHRDMEIISIPLQGDLEHKDSIGERAVIQEGEIQVMSAGTGITHSEYNPNPAQATKFLQLWIQPQARGVTPRYGQLNLQSLQTQNSFYQIVSPDSSDAGLWIHQKAWLHLGEFDTATLTEYNMKDPSHGLYVFQIQGSAVVHDHALTKGDGLALWDTETVCFSIFEKTKILLIEVPLGPCPPVS